MDNRKYLENEKLQEIYDRARSPMRFFILRNSGTEQDIEDVLQDAMIVFMSKCRDMDFHLSTSPENYVRSVAQKIWLYKLRRSKKDPIKPGYFEITEDKEEDVTFVNVKEDKLEMVRKALSSLSDDCRRIIQEFYLDQTPLRDLAHTLGLEYDSLKVKKSRCMNRLRKKIHG